MRYIGIDPGLRGAAVAVDEGGNLLGWFDVPTIKLKKGSTRKEYVPQDMIRSLVTLVDNDEAFICLEKQQPMNAPGSIARFMIGCGYGLWKGIICTLGYKFIESPPSAWPKEMLKGCRGEGKARSLQRCRDLLPSLPLSEPGKTKLTFDGRSDAGMLALYARKMS